MAWVSGRRAGGSGLTRRAARAAELLVLFAGIPAAFRAGLLRVPMIPALLAVTACCAAALWRDPAFDRRLLWNAARTRPALPGIAARAAIAAAVIALVVLARGGPLLELPRRRPAFFAAVVVLYPLLSAWPQELVYRTFFFHRYADLLGPRGTLLASGVAFAFLHVVFADPIAPLLSLPAGLVLAATYRRTGSLVAVAGEHALYGLAVFTLGLGRAFAVAAR